MQITEGLTLSFQTEFGKFIIQQDMLEAGMFRLLIANKTEEKILSKFFTINDAIHAVVQQHTGHIQWDNLELNKLPYKVFDITCWNFSK